MKSLLGSRLPKFTKAQSVALKGSIDFLGVNYYTTNYADAATPATVNHSFFVDMQATLTGMLIKIISHYLIRSMKLCY